MDKNKLILEDVKRLLSSSKIADRKKGVKLVQKHNIQELGDTILAMLENELEKNKSWQFTILIIETLGSLKYISAQSLLEGICKKNEEHDMITTASAKAYCRISRNNIHDATPESYLLSFGNFSVVNGALKALGQERIIPDEKNQNQIIQSLRKANFKREKGYSDVRIGLASACAGWNKTNEVESFLNECLQSDYSPLQKIAEKSIKGKYSSID